MRPERMRGLVAIGEPTGCPINHESAISRDRLRTKALVWRSCAGERSGMSVALPRGGGQVMSIKRLSRGLGAAAAFVLLIAAASSAQPVDHRTYFTFSGPVDLPVVALAPGKYLFRIANPESSGNVVQVLSADGTKSYAMFFA